jgi:Zn-dependent protease
MLQAEEGATFAEFLLHANLMLAIFSLLPVPPLAGFLLLYGALPRSLQRLVLRGWPTLWQLGPPALAIVVLAPAFAPGVPSVSDAINEAVRVIAPLLGGYEVVRSGVR